MRPESDQPLATPDWMEWLPEIHATLMFIQQGSRVLLIRKLRGIGEGKINGPGGKIDPGESPLDCVIRETQEELHITPLSPKKVGELWFAMSDLPDIHCHVFIAHDFTGTPTATSEAIPIWFEQDAIPYHEMWEDDQFWLPQALSGQLFNGRFLFEDERILWQNVIFGKEAEEYWRKS